MRTNSIILAALLVLIAVAGLANRARVARDFEVLRAERQATLAIMAARVDKLPELRERALELEVKLLRLFPGCHFRYLGFEELEKLVPRPRAKPVMPITLTPYEDESFTAEQRDELRELEDAIRKAHDMLPLVYEGQSRMERLREMIKTFERSPAYFLELGYRR